MLTAVILALSVGAAQPAPSDPPAAPTVSLDVVVTDARGQRVRTLTAADFTVVEGGRRLPVDAARFVDATAPPVTGSAPSPRLFGILLDDFHIANGAAAEHAREALTRFVRDDLGPQDSVLVLRPLDSLLTLTLSTDRAAALAAIAAFEPRRGDFAPRSDFERNFIAESPERAESARARIVTAAMNALIAHLGQFANARKSVILVSEGFVSGPPRRDVQVDLTLRSLAGAANRSNVAIYTLSPFDSAATPLEEGAEARRAALRTLAADTGGLTFESAADLRTALLTAHADAAGFYVLTFKPPADEDGGLEPVSITVTKAGMTVRAPRAYSRPRLERERMRVLSAAPSFLSSYSARFPRKASALILPWFGLSRGGDDRARVSFVWEPAPRVPGERLPRPTPSKVSMLVTTLEGDPIYEGTVLPATGSLTGRGEGMQAKFDTLPGRMLVQIAVQDISGRVIDRDVRDLVVRGFPGPVSLGTAAVLRGSTAREVETIAGDPEATPVASRQFSRRERLVIRVPVYGSGPPRVSARLRSAYGSVMRELLASAVPSRPELFQFDLPLSSFAAGAYTFEFEARTAEGVVADRLSIRITP